MSRPNREAAHVTELYDAGARNFLLVNLAFAPYVPAYAETNAAWASRRRGLAGMLDANLFFFDADDVLNRIVAAPADFGISNISDAALSLSGGVSEIVDNPEEYIRWDEAWHPTTAWHEVMGADAFASIVESPISGDYNANGRVGQADLDLVLLNWGAFHRNLPPAWVGERPGRVVDQAVLDRVLLRWGDTHPLASFAAVDSAIAGVPEPGTWVLITIVIACGLASRARLRHGERTH